MRLQDIYSQNLQISFEDAKKNTDFVKQVQTRLKSVGLYFGNVDGLWGPNTDKAIEEFCKRSYLNNFDSKVLGKTFAEKLIEAKAFLPKVAEIVTKARVDQFFQRTITAEQYQDLLRALEEGQITTLQRIRVYLSQIAHESGSLQWLQELASGQAYEFRKDLGNINPGDGPLYRGGGVIQITGRYWYSLAAKQLNDPEILKQGSAYVAKRYPFSSSIVWWKANNMNALIDSGADIYAITKRINGAYNGIQDRINKFNRAIAIFK